MQEVKTIKKVVLYARVSSDLQKRDKTIDSQIFELKRQIIADGNILVKEYIDNGFSGARLDRPAMDELRQDIRKNFFETIYFLNTDRIARDVTYQTIIISEILKCNKQIIVNGKDYVHNPENKFTITVLGAVAELERAKMIERVTRGRNMKLRQGIHGGRGANIYGYDYIKKTITEPQRLVINEREAQTVRYIFEEYVKAELGTMSLTRSLEEGGHLTKEGKSWWYYTSVKTILRNTAYAGTVYFNKYKLVREYANPLYGISKTRVKLTKRDKADWVGVPVPPIVSQELFDKAQERLKWNAEKYRNPRMTELLSCLIRCGICGSSCYANHRYKKRPTLIDPSYVIHLASYDCNKRFRDRQHSPTNGRARCNNKAVSILIFDKKVQDMIEDTMLNPEKLRTKISVLQGKKQNAKLRLRRKVMKIEKDILALMSKKKKIIDLYTSDNLGREEYVKKNKEFDSTIKKLEQLKLETLEQIPVLYDEHKVDLGIRKYCENARLRYEKCTDFQKRRMFYIEYIKKILHARDDISLFGEIPLGENGDEGKLEYEIKTTITHQDRYRPNSGCFKAGICHYRPFKHLRKSKVVE